MTRFIPAGDRFTYVVLAAMLQILALAPSAAAQEGGAPQESSVLRTLVGEWHGQGILLGRPAEFTMNWEAKDEAFYRLSFRNMWASDDGGLMPVLSAEAAYYVHGDTASGVWQDDRPQRLTIDAVLTDSSFVSHWTAESETGRTEYLVRSSDIVVVRDYVYTSDSERLFAEATYGRAQSDD